MTGPGIWLRVRSSLAPRQIEWILSGHAVIFGAICLSPSFAFTGASWAWLKLYVSEGQLGAIFVLYGMFRLVALTINGSMRRTTPVIRTVIAAVGCLTWTAMSISCALSNSLGVWASFYPVIALVEVLNIYRASHDIGKNYGPA